MNFIGLKQATIFEDVDNILNFIWSEKYYFPMVVNFQR